MSCEDGTRTLVCTSEDCAEVAPDLRIVETDLTSVDLAVAAVSSLRDERNAGLVSVRLPALSAGRIMVSGNPALAELDLRSLSTAALDTRSGDAGVTVIGNDTLEALSFPALLDAHVEVSENLALGSLRLAALTTGGVIVSGNPLLKDLSLPNLATVHAFLSANRPRLSPRSSGVDVTGNAALTAVDLPALVEGSVAISGNPALGVVSLPRFTTARTEYSYPYEQIWPGLSVIDNPALPALRFPALTAGSVHLSGNAALASVSLPALADGHVVIRSSGALVDIDLAQLATTWVGGCDAGVTIQGTAVRALSLPALTGGSVALSGNTALVSTTLPAFSRSWHRCPGFPAVSVDGNPSLTDLAMPALTAGNATVSGNDALPALTLPLQAVREGSLEIRDNLALKSISLPDLSTADHPGIIVAGNPVLTDLSFPAYSAGMIHISGNGALAELTLPSLVNAPGIGSPPGGGVIIGDNTVLTRVVLPALTSAGQLRVTRNGALTSLDVPSLSTISDFLEVVDNVAYPQCLAEAILNRLLAAPSVVTISGNDLAATCPP